MIKKIGEGFMFTLGSVLAITVVNMVNTVLDNAAKKAEETVEKTEE